MAALVLFHSVLGLRPGERLIAAAFKRAGHGVVLPDLYERPCVDDYDAAFALRREVSEEIIRIRAERALDAAPGNAVLAGISMGAYIAASFFPARPEMPGALLVAGLPPNMITARAGVPVSVHIARPDPFEPEDEIVSSTSSASEVGLDLHRYENVGHHFLDPSLTGYDASVAGHCLNRCFAFLGTLN